MTIPIRSTSGLSVAAVALLASVVACSQGPGSSPIAPSVTGGSTAVQNPIPGPNVGLADPERFEVCKIYSNGSGPTVTFNVSVDAGNNGSVDTSFSIALGHGQCQDVWGHGGSTYDSVTVTEVGPANHTTSFVRQTFVAPNRTTDAPVSGLSASGLVRGNTGTTVTFTNTPNEPPPPGGGQGCTPGYWKQSHHFDSWPAAYLPTDPFSSVFANAFPGMTLVEVAAQGGGGIKALGRHTVAALLNAASNGVSFGLTVADVINGFNAAYASGNYETFKDQLAGLNEAGCPLN